MDGHEGITTFEFKKVWVGAPLNTLLTASKAMTVIYNVVSAGQQGLCHRRGTDRSLLTAKKQPKLRNYAQHTKGGPNAAFLS